MKYVYFLRNGQDYYKVGVAVNVASRVRTIQTSNPERVTLICSRLVRNAEDVETKIHSELIERKSGGGSEWFMLTPEDALEVAALINLEPQPRVLDRQMTIESLLADMREERQQLRAEVVGVGKMVTAVATKLVDQDTKREMNNLLIQLPQEAASEQKDEVVKPTFDQYEEMAIKIFREVGSASSSLLQRRLGIGYAKAARIVDNLEEKGFIGPSTNSSKRRSVKQ